MSTSRDEQIAFVGPSRAELQPSAPCADPGPNEILVQTTHTLVSPGTELSWFSGMQREVAGDAFTYPVYSGYCHTGPVLACGPNVADFSEGDTVVSGAPHASRVLLNTEKSLELSHADLRKPVAVVPPEIPPEHAAFAKIGEIALTALRVSEFSLGEKVFVLGQGMVGNLAAQLFQLAGADVLAADLSAFRLERARMCGIGNLVNPSTDDVTAAVDEWTGGQGADVTVESVGDSRLILNAVHQTRRLGEIILLGTPRKAHQLNPTPELWHAHMKGITVKGALRCLFYPLYPGKFHRRSVATDLALVLRMLAGVTLQVAPLHTHTYAPDRCQEAFSDLLEARDRAIGAVFDWGLHG